MKQVIATREDGSQILVELWPTGEATVAERPDTRATWGIPIESVEVREVES